jgi:hypothetical protein
VPIDGGHDGFLVENDRHARILLRGASRLAHMAWVASLGHVVSRGLPSPAQEIEDVSSLHRSLSATHSCPFRLVHTGATAYLTDCCQAPSLAACSHFLPAGLVAAPSHSHWRTRPLCAPLRSRAAGQA